DMTFFFFSSRCRHTIFSRDWSSDVCSSDLPSDRDSREKPKAIAFRENVGTVIPRIEVNHVFLLEIVADPSQQTLTGRLGRHPSVLLRSRIPCEQFRKCW